MNSTIELASQRSMKICWTILSTYAPLASVLGHHAPKMTPLELRRVAPSIFIRRHSCQRNRRRSVKYL
jgi:hypothetical protein